MHNLDMGPATRRAPFLPLALCYSALEPRPGSQYSPRPLESTQKKTANVKADLKANLSRPDVCCQSAQKSPEFDCIRCSRRGFFGFFQHLGAALAKSIKADRTDDFCSEPKGATPERLRRRKTIKF
ncbi:MULTISPECIES: hypothetical protein [Pseudomonas]|uniref:hypothetical protein n=1 Tax=Pseudomonas TaxID=286 RepID=UPI001C311887|nr:MULTISPECIES: hypothetical protein [Pseudomonas]MBV2080125.1 hypothetical protein [Pseudomonas carnis]MBV2085867.1 hypothetical protein [Pseudomonas carnis]MDO3690071.1 hypothetical protein [Pseudomonas sp. DKN 2791]MDO7032763.1 hypothetical protein [Pseudomonas sp. DKN 2792]